MLKKIALDKLKYQLKMDGSMEITIANHQVPSGCVMQVFWLLVSLQFVPTTGLFLKIYSFHLLKFFIRYADNLLLFIVGKW